MKYKTCKISYTCGHEKIITIKDDESIHDQIKKEQDEHLNCPILQRVLKNPSISKNG